MQMNKVFENLHGLPVTPVEFLKDVLMCAFVCVNVLVYIYATVY